MLWVMPTLAIPSAPYYEEQLPALLVELGQAAAAAGQNWQTWSAADPDAVNSIIAKYV